MKSVACALFCCCSCAAPQQIVQMATEHTVVGVDALLFTLVMGSCLFAAYMVKKVWSRRVCCSRDRSSIVLTYAHIERSG